MKILTHNDIVSLNISPIDCYNWVADLLARKDEVILPTKISLHLTEDTYYNIMPSVFQSEAFAGVKTIMRHPEALPALSSQIMLHDLDKGNLKAILDGSWITSMRTGAVAAHSIKTLAREDFYELGVMGLGNTCRAAMKVLLALYPERELKVKVLRYKDQHNEFISLFETDYPHAHFEVVDTHEEIVRGSDVVVSAITYTDGVIAQDEWFKEGCTVIPIHLRGFMNCDLFFDKVFCDDLDHVKGFKYFDQFKYIAEVAEVVSERKAGRESDDERIIAYNVGLSMHDINYAERIFEMIQNEDGTNYVLDPPAEKFYIC